MKNSQIYICCDVSLIHYEEFHVFVEMKIPFLGWRHCGFSNAVQDFSYGNDFHAHILAVVKNSELLSADKVRKYISSRSREFSKVRAVQ